MDNKIKEYRTKHKKCKGCKYYKINRIPVEPMCYYTCDLKDKIINGESLPRLCKGYELKEDNKND